MGRSQKLEDHKKWRWLKELKQNKKWRHPEESNSISKMGSKLIIEKGGMAL